MQENQKSKKPKLNFKTDIIARGNFIPLSLPLIEFMGLVNAVFLTGLLDHYYHLRKHKKVKNGELFYTKTVFEKTLGLSLYQQNRAINELNKCCLLKKIRNTFRNQKVLQINILACCCLLRLVYDIQSKIDLGSFYKKIQGNKEFHTMIRGRLKGMKSEGNGAEIPENGEFSYQKFKDTILEKLKIYS